MQRVNEASVFEVTTSRSCETVNGFQNVTFGPGGKAIISCSVFRQYSWFQLLKAFSALGSFFPCLSAIFLSGRGNLKENYVNVVYEIWWVSYLFFSFQIWYFRKWIITSIGQSKHLRVTRFNPLWVSGIMWTVINNKNWVWVSGRKNVMSMRELFCPDPQAGFEKMAGFQIFYCLKIRCFHS